MNPLKLSTVLTRILLCSLLLLLLLLTWRLVYDSLHYIQHKLLPSTNLSSSKLLGISLLVFGRFILFLALVYILYTLSRIAYSSSKHWSHLPRGIRPYILQISQSNRSKYLLLLATIGSLYILFFYSGVTALLLWPVVLFCSALLIRWPKKQHDPVAWATLVTLYLFALCCTLKLYKLQNYHLFNDLVQLGLSFGATILFIILFSKVHSATLKVFAETKDRPDESIHAAIPFTGLAFMPYALVALTTINCYYDPMQNAVNIDSTVIQVCPVYGNSYYLNLSYTHKGKTREVIMPSPAQLHQIAQPGMALRLHLHPGVLGWPWYHNTINLHQK